MLWLVLFLPLVYGQTQVFFPVATGACSSTPCQNGGLCIEGANNTYTCRCIPGWEGTNCTVSEDDCVENECDGGTCVDAFRGYTCDCDVGYDGLLCDQEEPGCDLNPCQNGATCDDSTGFYNCTCPPGWEGVNCEINIDNCEGGPCPYAWTCTDDGNGFDTHSCTPVAVPASTSCPAGQYVDNGACSTCPEGYSQIGTGIFNVHQETSCTICPIGRVTYDGSDGLYPAYGFCHECHYTFGTNNQYYMDEIGFTGTECKPCPHNSIVTTPGEDCLTPCWAGRYSATGYMTEGDPDSCTVCAVGYYAETSGDGYRMPYPSGTYYHYGNAVTECTECPIGYHDYENPADTHPFRHCTRCAEIWQEYGTEPAQEVCKICPSYGTQGAARDGVVTTDSVTGAGTGCFFCQPGEYFTGDASASYNTGDPAAQCADCTGNGYTSNAMNTQCFNCPAGSGNIDNINCNHCSNVDPASWPGPYTYIGDGASACTQCPAGEFTSDQINCIDFCNLNPCSNGGTCTNTDVDSRTCDCSTAPGWEGTECTVSIDDCPGHSCQNGGTCVDGHQTYTCDCSTAPGWGGALCDTYQDPCTPSDPCDKGQYDSGGCQASPQFADRAAWLTQINSCKSTHCAGGVNGFPEFGRYDTSQVQDMKITFPNFGTLFNPAGPVDWDTSSVTTMERLFRNNKNFQACLWEWDTSKVTSMKWMFRNAEKFNKPLIFDTSSVETMDGMFHTAMLFNQDLNWDTSSVTTMNEMFYDADDFNGDVSNWDTAKVENFNEMFERADAFNIDISNWDTSKVTTFHSMFWHADVFGQDVSNWDFTAATSVNEMFYFSNVPADTWCMDTNADYSTACNSAPCTIYCPPTPCDATPCQNGATCSDTGVGGTYTCDCSTAPGFSGTDCEFNIDDCGGHGCLNGATCVDGINTYTCDCSTAPGWEGALCGDSIDDCPGNSCQNGATCVDGHQTYTCDCSTAPGWTNALCDVSIDAVPPPQPVKKTRLTSPLTDYTTVAYVAGAVVLAGIALYGTTVATPVENVLAPKPDDFADKCLAPCYKCFAGGYRRQRYKVIKS